MEEFKFYEDYDALEALVQNPFQEECDLKIKEIKDRAMHSACFELNFWIDFEDMIEIGKFPKLSPSFEFGRADIGAFCSGKKADAGVIERNDSFFGLYCECDNDILTEIANELHREKPDFSRFCFITESDVNFNRRQEYLFVKGNSMDLLKKFLSLQTGVGVIKDGWLKSKDYEGLFNEISKKYRQLESLDSKFSCINFHRTQKIKKQSPLMDRIESLKTGHCHFQMRDLEAAKRNWELFRPSLEKYERNLYNFRVHCHETVTRILQSERCLERIEETKKEYAIKHKEKFEDSLRCFIEKYELNSLKKYVTCFNDTDDSCRPHLSYDLRKFVKSTQVGKNKLKSMSELKLMIEDYISFKEKERLAEEKEQAEKEKQAKEDLWS